jgi:phosphoglycolate phosphatase-like HAD superfamily hydrolase
MSEKPLIVLDIDGTLTKTLEADTRCVTIAFEQAFGFPMRSADWTDYPHVTDRSIADTELLDRSGKQANRDQIEMFSMLLEVELEHLHRIEPHQFDEVPGAARILDLFKRESWYCCLATGCLEASARYKCKAAGLEINDIPGAFAEDGISREDIVQKAIERAEEKYGRKFNEIISVGDGIWDWKTAQQLNIGFIGIDAYQNGELIKQGAEPVFSNLDEAASYLAQKRMALSNH